MRITYLILFLTVAIQGCENHIDEMKPCEALLTAKLSYSAQVYPIITHSCAVPGCHVAGFEHGNFNQFEDVESRAKNGTLEFMIGTDQMPHGNTIGPKYLTTCEIETIKKWIKNGAEFN